MVNNGQLPRYDYTAVRTFCCMSVKFVYYGFTMVNHVTIMTLRILLSKVRTLLEFYQEKKNTKGKIDPQKYVYQGSPL